MSLSVRTAAMSSLLLASAACSSEQESLNLGPAVLTHGLQGCPNDAIDGVTRDGYTCLTYRGVGGISMGGGSGARIALADPELFDVVTPLGAPYIDMEYFLFSVSRVSNGGFCAREQLLENLDFIDEKDDPRTWCGPVTVTDTALPGTNCIGGSGDYNHFYRGTPAGRGGSFSRVGSLQIVQDFALAFGNPAFYNPDSPYLPPGVTAEHIVPRELEADGREEELEARRREICQNPKVLEHSYDRTWNPTGEFPLITFCDGNGPENGVYEPGTATFPMEIALTVDYNRNGRRDYGEPVVAQSFEPYDDFGADGVADGEGDPTGDDYDWFENPKGTERNSRWDPGERFSDDGLDGVAGTGDFGEGNGVFDLSPNVSRAFEASPRRLLEVVDEIQLARMHLWADAGIRDFLMTAQITNQFWGALTVRTPKTRLISDFGELAALGGQTGAFDPGSADFSEQAIGRHAYLRYGDPSVCPDVDWENGRGNHVGTTQEVLNRLMSAFAFASARFEGGDFDALPGGLVAQGGPTGGLGDFVKSELFESAALGRRQPYVVILPPDYYSDPTRRYPVMYFLHGQGMKATDLSASALLFLGPQMESTVPERIGRRRSDWQKLLLVFADGQCGPGECHEGSFYSDFMGFDGQGPRHGEAFFELMRHIEGAYRTKGPEMRPRTP
ncbi:MAG: hypothetical protein HY791_16550 [Deltaproteobacteria bacterium]|nr:hypothetical protein [Deltaproteobacteria bacterium]